MLNISLTICVIVFALVFDFTNGFHDAANAIATVVATRAMSIKVALISAASMNLLGALLGTQVAKTIANDIINIERIGTYDKLVIIFAAICGAITFNIMTWYFGMPSSSSHALIGGLTGAGLGAISQHIGISVKWASILDKVFIPMIFSPLLGFICGYFFVVIFHWILRKKNPGKVFGTFKKMQIFSSMAIALGHGLQDAQKSMGIIFLACASSGMFGVKHSDKKIPFFIIVICAVSIGLGTLIGGKRIMKTLGQKVINLDPQIAFVSESVSATILYITSFFIHAPVSTTHVITSTILGSGAVKRFRSVKWGTALNIVKAWLFTFPTSGLIGFIFFYIFKLIFHVF